MKYQPSAERYDKMQYKYCGNSGLLLPRISLGLWHNFGSVDDFGVATDMIKYAFIMGLRILTWLIIMAPFREVLRLILVKS